MAKQKLGFGTIALHAGEDKRLRSHVTPIFRNASWEIRSERELELALSGKLPLYHRHGGNPTVAAVEKKLCELEGGARAHVFSCRLRSDGMNAVALSILAAMKTGEHAVIIGPMYGGTYKLIQMLAEREGHRFTFLPAIDPDLPNKIARSIYEETVLVFGEITTNPTIAVWDVSAVSEIIKQRFSEIKYQKPVLGTHEHRLETFCKPLLIVDTSFASPYNFRPFEHGADIVVRSETKYVGGRGAFVLGSILISQRFSRERLEYWNLVSDWAEVLGGSPSAEDAWLLGEFAEDLHLRMLRHNENAKKLAKFLENHSAVISVLYPGLESNPQYSLATRLLRTPYGEPGYGGMVSFRVKGGLEAAKRFLFEVTKHTFVKHKPSLGYTKTIVESPWLMSQRGMSDAHKELFGITDDLIRVSVGAEDTEDIIKAFKFVLDKLC